MSTAATSIAWTERTWNPVTGCSKVSPGCTHCYAEGIAERFRGTSSFPNGFDVTLKPERLEEPLRWRKPAMVFVNSMSDLFHDDVPFTFIRAIFATMGKARQHTFQILTKRPERMQEFFQHPFTGPHLPAFKPLPNVWLGVSVENHRFLPRIKALRQVPAAVRFVSFEPLLDDLWPNLEGRLYGIDWAIIGGESGPGARPMSLEWVAEILQSCRSTGTAPFVKQLGSVWARRHGLRGKGEDPDEWPEWLRVREWPEVPTP